MAAIHGAQKGYIQKAHPHHFIGRYTWGCYNPWATLENITPVILLVAIHGAQKGYDPLG